MEDKELIQKQLTELVQKDLLEIFTEYSKTKILNLELIVTLIQDINLFKLYNVTYIHNLEFNEIIDLIREELKNFNIARSVALLTCFDFLQNINQDFKKLIYMNLSLKVPSEIFLEVFCFFNVLASTVKELFNEFIIYIFNDRFLTLDENIQIELIYKIWSFSQKIFHDNEASRFAYDNLKPLFDKALLFEKTEVAFWLYYTPLHYFYSTTGNNVNELNENFKNEIEKPLEQYILNKLVAKYNITPNNKIMSRNAKIKVAFVMQRIIRHSTMNVFYSLIKNLMVLKNDKYEFTIYDLSFPEADGSQKFFVKEFLDLGIEYRNLHQEIFENTNPTYSLLTKCIKTREILINDNIDVFIGLHTRVEYIFLYATRTSPKQIYWYHASNAQYDIKGIDERITHAKSPKNEFNFIEFLLPNKENKTITEIDKTEIDKIRAEYPRDSFILGYIGRLIKIENEEYLTTIAQIMKQNSQTIFLACGGGDQTKIQEIVNKLEIGDRFYFTGHIDPHLYGYVIDLFLSSFIGGGESLSEFAAKAKPFVLKVDKEKLTIQELEMYESTIVQYHYARNFALSNEDFINVANKLINEPIVRMKLIGYIKREYVEQEFGSIIYFLRELGYYSGKGFVELLDNINQKDIDGRVCKQLAKLDFYKVHIEKTLNKFNLQKNFNIGFLIEKLALGSIKKRAYYNYIIAEYLYEHERYIDAKIYIDRAWVLFQFDKSVLPIFIKINEAVGDIDAVYEAYKRLGMNAEKDGDIGQAIYYFNKAHYCKAYFEKADDYKYDFDILDSIERMAKPYIRQKVSMKHRAQKKVVFLMYGLSHTNSVLVKLNLKWLKNIQNEEVHIVIVDKKHTINNDEAISNVTVMLNMGHKVHIFPNEESDSKRLVHIVQSINDLNADVIVTGAAMAKYEHAFIIASKPAPKIMGFLYGPPEQFAYPFMDGLITHTYHPALDTPAKKITFEQITYEPKKTVQIDKTALLNLSLDTIILTSIGRYTKFQSKLFLRKIETILIQHPNVYYVICGIDKAVIASFFDEKISNRIICTGWIENVNDYLSVTDIFIDTYPSGGGVALLEAYNYKIPTIMFKNNFNKKYTQKEWSLDKELINIPELVIEDIYNNRFEDLVGQLLEDSQLRKEFGERLYIYLQENFIQKKYLGKSHFFGT